ncbi:hypothetical protein JG687_00015037 [Phytophthora cactorum]|uniref:Uncharacterized protein n=1 Tax=Phytophthora cactorum TaxID=29920 RepID=A0A8T1TX07_9STRA|nr:hypothetical protein JG687_00015037 [Phytophthora cactorum]
MKDVRREGEYMCTGLIMQYMKAQQPQWLHDYIATKDIHEQVLSTLMRLCQRFAAR